ncbi:MAG: phenylalanine--tRNA ligase subunit alpha [Chloroflexota bacterium]
MTDWNTELSALAQRARSDLAAAADSAALEQWRVAYLGRRGALTDSLRKLSTLPADQRPAAGQAANETKQALERALQEREADIRRGELDSALERERLDVTLPARPPLLGGLHPTSVILRQILGFFRSIGYQVVEGPEVELEKYNFEMLNIPGHHPARDMWDTLYVRQPEVLLRTHTSPMQARVMESTTPPVRVVVPGRCYRYEAQDATHEWMFYQVEGLAVDEGLTMSDLKGTLFAFARHLFGSSVKVRFRCDYFPFVEPGVDMSISSPDVRNGAWIEVLGAGMVHRRVLQMAGYDPDRYTGFAFGMGPERLAMLKYGISDIRYFYGNDLRFLEQFVG